MAERPFNVLFLCTANSARSIMAEAILNKIGAGKFRAFSAGSHPRGQINAQALQLLQSLGYDTSGFRSKSWSEFADPSAPLLDFVFTVCDSAAGEVCPVWPGQPMTAHWGVPDPAEADGRRRRLRLRSKTPIACSIGASAFSRRCRCARLIGSVCRTNYVRSAGWKARLPLARHESLTGATHCR
jgi:protein-tyrosine-phosphatase